MNSTIEPSCRWTPQLLEDILFRQYIKNEDISSRLPPPPASATSISTENFDKSTKMLFNYVRNGPLAVLAPQNVNTSVTPVKSSGTSPKPGRPAAPAPTYRVPSAAPTRAQTPVQKSSSRAPSPGGPKSSTSPLPASGGGVKRSREWPSQVPTNRSLCSSSRSKVQHLTAQRVAAQECVDPDLIFQQNPGDLPLHVIFAGYPSALKAVNATRNASGDWRHDTFTSEEEAQYKRELGYRYIGPSQCCVEI